MHRQKNQIVAEVNINDISDGSRSLLTRGSFQNMIGKMSRSTVSTTGRYITSEEKAARCK